MKMSMRRLAGMFLSAALAAGSMGTAVFAEEEPAETEETAVSETEEAAETELPAEDIPEVIEEAVPERKAQPELKWYAEI